MTEEGSIRYVAMTVDPYAVGLPSKLAAAETSAIFSVAHNALETADLENLPKIEGETLRLHMEIANRSAADHRDACNRRLAAMCISDLARGIRATMEAAAAHIDFRDLDMTTLARSTEQEVMNAANAKLSELTATAQSLNYPPLLEKVQAGLTSPLKWAPELASFQKLRNCLEHRGGVVGDRDLDSDGVLNLRLPFLDLGFINDDGGLDPIRFNVPLERETMIGARVAVRHRTFALGEAVVLPANSIREIAFSVWLFADDLVVKLSPNAHPSASASS